MSALVVVISAVSPLSTYTEIVSTRLPYAASTYPSAPSWTVLPFNDAHQVVALPSTGALLLASAEEALGIFLATESNKTHFARILLDAKIPSNSGSRLVVEHSSVVALATPSGIWSCSCVLSAAPYSCKLRQVTSESYGNVHAAIGASDGAIWLAADAGLYRMSSAKTVPTRILSGHFTSVAVAESGGVVAGNAERLWDLRADGSISRWEWATEPDAGWGGVVGPVTSLAFGPTLGPSGKAETALSRTARAHTGGVSLYVGTSLEEINVRDGAGAFTRVGADAGLPIGNVTAVLPSVYAGAAQLWVGSRRGVALWQPGYDPEWRYMGGARWLVGESVRSMARVGAGAVVVVSDGGVTWLEQEEWTLARKAALYEAMLSSRHDRHGLTSECEAAAFGAQARSCVMADNDNNGLWTSLVVVAEYLRYSVTGEPAALQSGSRFYAGMELLNAITGKRGLMARSACDPAETNVTCAVHSAGGDKRQWLPSTAAPYSGWVWKSDTSSDEVVGHVFALLAVAQLSPLEAERARAAALLVDIVGGVCTSGRYALIDVTGEATTWARWGPADVNERRAWSDERGLQSLQMLAFLSAALNVSSANASLVALWHSAYDELTAETSQYLANLLNLKITWPEDDNYSDDELAFLPWYTLLVQACPQGSLCDQSLGALRPAALAGLERTARIVRPLRSSLWSAIRLAVSTDAADHDDALRSLRWNLRSWPLELVDWPVSNSHRIDLVYERGADRFHKAHSDSWHVRSPLPANERRQMRWNANPFEVADGGDGLSEGDPGAWLLPYWMGRAIGVLSAEE